jgi:cystathionine beta-lyase/cystathionine gamma-synthase
MDFARKALGLNPSPFDAWLTLRGVKTLVVRMNQHISNTKKIIAALESHPLVKHIYYPGLASHPEHHIARKQMYDFGGMISVDFHLSLDETKALISGFSLFSLAESLGGVESLVDHPATMTHASIPAHIRHAAGLGDGLVRFSVGIEDADDLIEDLISHLNHFIR